MSVFDLFRGFFGVPGGHYRGRRDPFFDAMTHDDDDEDDEEDEDVFYYDEFRGDQQDPFDGDWRFGFSFGPNGVRIQEPPVFGQVLREMEEIFSQLGREDGQHFGVPKLPPPEDGGKSSEDRSSGNPLRDFMLKSPDTNTHGLREPRKDSQPSYESPGVYGWTPFPKVDNSHSLFSANATFGVTDAINVIILKCLGNSSVIFGNGDHRQLQRMSAKKTEISTLQFPLEVWIRF
ncbi:HCLS1-associated protein X-1 [Xyrichtys novacula]|uniref:HCLS1-associated protein X-1 n=1 Tax=Xyrichtys novacula TaxID=13765 RepID=A0AAV1HBV3_XYRNO|nr:HCLS1-associated protein X-1 [Xyrichtys novacula]